VPCNLMPTRDHGSQVEKRKVVKLEKTHQHTRKGRNKELYECSTLGLPRKTRGGKNKVDRGAHGRTEGRQGDNSPKDGAWLALHP